MRILRKACLGLLRLFGWTTSLTWPPEPRGLIMVYPHTSNWDFIIGVLFRVGSGLPAQWMGKDSMFRWPVRKLFVRIGGVPINRRERTGLVTALVEEFQRRDWMWLAIAPEGTRSHADHLKSGFYQVAVAANLPIGLGYIDYGRRPHRHRPVRADDGRRGEGPRHVAKVLCRQDGAFAGARRGDRLPQQASGVGSITNGRRPDSAQESMSRGKADAPPGATHAMSRSQDVHPQRAARFAFVLHPLTIDYLARHPLFGWTRHLPKTLVEEAAAHMPAARVGGVAGGRSPATDQRIEGLIYALGATPRQMLRRPPEFTYRRLDQAVRDAANAGARIVGLGAFTKVVGDAGVTVARRAPIPVTTGNSLTIAATLETAKLTAKRLGWPNLARGKAMIVGATGSIGSVCSRLLAAAVHDVVLVSIEPDRLMALKQKILAETPGTKVELDTSTQRWVGECDLIVTATSAFGQRVLDVSQCKPGAVILDVALLPTFPRRRRRFARTCSSSRVAKS